jgi:beta-galactosidase beta subunit
MKKLQASMAPVLTAGVVVLVITQLQMSRQQSRLEYRLAAVKACVSNDAYQGRTAADTHELFFQCMTDYSSSTTDK